MFKSVIAENRSWTRGWKIARGWLLSAALAVTVALAGCSSGSENSAAEDQTSEAAKGDAGGSKAEAGSADTGNSSGKSSSDSSTDSSGSTAESPAEGTSGDKPSKPIEEREQPDPQAGMLTAGEWNDLSHWDDWQQLLDSHEGEENREYWSFERFERLDVQVTGGGKPASDVQVSVIGNDGQSVWEARTDVNGRAAAFAGLFDRQESQDGYLVEVESEGEVKRFENVPIPRGKTLKIELDEGVPVSDQLDLMLVVDTTGSMGDELKYLKTELRDVVERVGRDNGQRLDIRVSTNFYRDKGDDYVVKSFPFTKDIGEAEKQIAAQRANGGADYPEAVDQALDDAIHNHDWSDRARARLLFLVLDAPPHHRDSVVKRMQELTRDAAEEGIRIIPVASSGVDANTEYLMRFMAVATGGTYLFLTDHSGIGNDHKEADVGEYEVKQLNDLLVEVINRYCASQSSSGSQ
jgi:hypothetical protein